MVIGLTGKFCTGKNRVGSILQQLGWDVIDVDLIGHKVLEEQQEKLIDHFGPSILDEAGRVDRKVIASLVLADKARLALLESIIHPKMVESCKDLIASRDTETYPHVTVLNAAVLYKMGLDSLCDVIVYVKASPILRFLRARSTREMGLREFLRRDRVQRTIAPEYAVDEKPLYVIMNNLGDGWLKRQLDALTADLKVGD